MLLILPLLQHSYVVKFLFSVMGLLAVLATNLFLASYLGPYIYGQYGYIIAASTFITQIVLVTLPETYVFYLSSNKYSIKETNAAYLFCMLIIFLMCLLFFIVSMSSPALLRIFWPQTDSTVNLVLGFLGVLLITLQQGLTKYGDCSSQYNQVEWCRLLSRLAILLLLIILWQMQQLNLTTYFTATLISASLFFIVFVTTLSFPVGMSNKDTFKCIVKELYQGWKPVSFYAFFWAFYIFLGRYGIQMVSGAMEQGFYTYAQFLAQLPLAVLAPMITLYMSHMAKLYSTGQSVRLAHEYLSLSRTAIILYGSFSFFLISNAHQIIALLSGEAFEGAALPLQWLAIYYFLNMFDILGGNLYFCTDRTHRYRLIYNCSSLIGLVLLGFYSLHTITALNLAKILTIVLAFQIGLHLYGNVRYLNLTYYSLVIYLLLPLLAVTLSGLLINLMMTEMIWRLLAHGMAVLLFTTLLKPWRHPIPIRTSPLS